MAYSIFNVQTSHHRASFPTHHPKETAVGRVRALYARARGERERGWGDGTDSSETNGSIVVTLCGFIVV